MFHPPGKVVLLIGLALGLASCHPVTYRDVYSPRRNHFKAPPEKKPGVSAADAALLEEHRAPVVPAQVLPDAGLPAGGGAGGVALPGADAGGGAMGGAMAPAAQ